MSIRGGDLNLRLGIVQQDKYPLTEEDLQNKNFKLLMAQTKFLGSEINYSEEELLLLKEWIQTSPDVSKIKEIYERKILKDNPLNPFILAKLHEAWEEAS